MNKNIKHLSLSDDSTIDEDCQFYIECNRLCNNSKFHWHNFYEIQLVLCGDGINVFNNHSHEIHTGDLMFLSPTDFHDIGPVISDDPKEALYFETISFSSAFLTDDIKYLLSIVTSKMYSFRGNEFNELIYELNQTKNDYMSSNGKMRILFVKNHIERICLLLIRNKGIDYSNEDGTSVAIAYIEDKFREDISLGDLAKITHMSEAYFSNLFHKTYNMTFKEYLNNKRLDWAVSLIKNTDMSITDVCFESGFNSLNYFTRCFKKKYKKTPSEYRK